jgi:serine protease Do
MTLHLLNFAKQSVAHKKLWVLLWCALTILLQAPVTVLASTIFAADAMPANDLPQPSAPARDLFARHKASLVQVRVLLSSADQQSSLGSGFFVSNPSGSGVLIMTNYHVVSALALDPAKYRLEVRRTDEQAARATLLAIDVHNDLAVLRLDDSVPTAKSSDKAKTFAPGPALVVRNNLPRQGERVYALGHPLELGFLIAEGVYNGLAEARIHDQMLFSGALNSGMSGGPALDDRGQLVGVNVSVRSGAQLLSFLVPARHVTAVLGIAANARPRNEWRGEIGKQLHSHQAIIAARLFPADVPTTADVDTATIRRAGFTSQTLVNRSLLALDGSLTKCWANTAGGDKPRVQTDSLRCTLSTDVYVSGRLSTGNLSINHAFLRNVNLATSQFVNRDSQAKVSSDYASRHLDGARSGEECSSEYFQGKQQVYRVLTCVQAFRKFDGLYRLRVSAMQVDSTRERLSSSLNLDGFNFANAQRISQLFLSRLP